MKYFSIKLFYSYCHADGEHKKNMEKSLSILKRNELLMDWSDRKILPGQNIPQRIKEEMNSSNIIVFLISPDFLSSDSCIKEWDLAKKYTEESNKTLLSVILRDCAWKDLDDLLDYLVLPEDGNPIVNWDNQDTAWQNVYEGIKKVIVDYQKTFELKPDFKTKLSCLEFCSQSREEIFINDLFVFPMLYTNNENSEHEEIVPSTQSLLKNNHVMIRGDDQSGKTKLCSHLFLELSKEGSPVIFINLDEIKSKKPNRSIYTDKYSEQYSGDYDQWFLQENKTIIFDNLSSDANSLEHVIFALESFEKIIVSTSNDKYRAYFKDEDRLTDFSIIRIAEFTHTKQEELIKKWTKLKKEDVSEDIVVEHGEIDRLERNINEVIINNKVLPRYPFFILSILQTYEAFMPQDVQITAYGHCYYALILAHLIKSGVDKKDDAIDSCFNFSSHLAFVIYNQDTDSLKISKNDFDAFVKEYNATFIIKESTINRLYSPHGILSLSPDGNISFSLPYSYYFFLGRFLAKTFNENGEVISRMIEKSYVRKNTLSLIFAIHHANDIEIIDDILLHTLCAVDMVEPSKLDNKETLVFQELLSSIPKKIISDLSIEEERANEREARDQDDLRSDESDIIESEHEFVNQIYKSQKNMEILSQILKNKHGSLRKEKIEEIVEIICNTGLRLINLFLYDESEINDLTRYIEKKYEKSDYFDGSKANVEKTKDLRKMLSYVIFLWTMTNIEKIVTSICKPEIWDIIKSTRNKMNTPAYDIIHYFYSLDISEKFDKKLKQELESLFSKYKESDMFFLREVLSIRTQRYMNTHEIKGPIKQSISSTLGISYKP